MSAKKRYSGMTILQKLYAIRAVDSKIKSKSAVAQELGIPRSTLSTYLKNRHSIERQAARGANISVRKRMRTGKHADLENELYEWLRVARLQQIPVTAALVRDKAREIASKLNLDFQCSNGWLHRFQQRHNIGLSTRSKLKAKNRNATDISIFDSFPLGENPNISITEANTSGNQTGESSTGPSENTTITNGSFRSYPMTFPPVDSGPDRKRMRHETQTHPDLEDCLLLWYIQACKQNLPITGQILQERASEFAQLLGYENRHFSDSWVGKFKARKGIALKKQREEFLALPSTSSAAEPTESSHTKQSDVTNFYPRKDIFTVIETGLLSRLLPNEKPEEWSPKILRSVDGDFAEERFTLMMVCNMDGTEKLPLVIIGKNEENQLSTAIPSIEYAQNEFSWITSEIVENWILRLDQKMKDEGRTIALVSENGLFGALKGKLQNVQIFVRPPHSARHLTLQSSKIVSSFKLRYRRTLLSQILKRYKAGEGSPISFTDTLCWLSSAWVELKPDASACSNGLSPEEQEIFDDCHRMIEEFCLHRDEANDVGNFSVDSYMRVDDHLCTVSSFTPQEIVTIFQKYGTENRHDETGGRSEGDFCESAFRSLCIDENSGLHGTSGKGDSRPRRDTKPEVADEIIVPNIDSALAIPMYSSVPSSEHLRDSPRSVISEGGSGVELCFTVEHPNTQTDGGLDFSRGNQEHQSTITAPEGTSVPPETHPHIPGKRRASSELPTHAHASGPGDNDGTRSQNPSRDRSSSHPDTNHVTDRSSRGASTPPSSGNTLPHSRLSLPCIHLSSGKAICAGTKPTAGDAMAALMVVHSYILSKPNVNGEVSDSFCHLVRFLSDSVVEESQQKCNV